MRIRIALGVGAGLTAAALLAAAIVTAQVGTSTTAAESMTGNCAGCHLCSVPTMRVPCLKACPRTTMVHQTSRHALAEAPDALLLDDLVDLYEPVHFDHQAHASMAEMGKDCATCHHYSPPGTIPPCKECHSLGTESSDLRKPNLKGAYHRQCLGCHVEWSHETECNACHLPRGEVAAPATGATAGASDPTDIVGRAHPPIESPVKRVYRTPYAAAPIVTFQHKEHSSLFGFRCVDCHSQESCTSCHDWRKSAAAPERSQAEVHALCNACHAQDPCAKCHDTKERAGFTHNRTGWPLNPYHQRLDCWSCHPRGKDFKRVNRMCASCHGAWSPENFQHAVTGMRLDEMHSGLDCTQCHKDRHYDADPTCSDCHDDGRTAENAPPGEKTRHR